jgi:enhancing lycopene biosynthesis protein 2
MGKKIAVVLSGCGVNDGAEIHESVLVLLALDRAGVEAVCVAPNVDQVDVVDHRTGTPVPGESRNVLVESARIARGNVKDLATVTAGDVDGAVFPGGFGAAKNLCDYAVKGRDMAVNPGVARFIRELRAAGKPMGFLCISPVLAAWVLGPDHHPEVTVGNDKATAADVTAWGARHKECPATQVVVDRANKVVTTPAYMLAQGVAEAATGIEAACRAVVDLA